METNLSLMERHFRRDCANLLREHNKSERSRLGESLRNLWWDYTEASGNPDRLGQIQREETAAYRAEQAGQREGVKKQ